MNSYSNLHDGEVMKRSLGIIISAIILGGCSAHTDNPPLALGLGGAAAGAGTGAIIGSVIDGGSPGIGAAIGAGAGALIGVAAGYQIEDARRAELARKDADIRMNQLEINSNQRALQDLQQRVLDDSQRAEPDSSRVRKVYDGPTVGNPYR
jgi:hypothetical protein